MYWAHDVARLIGSMLRKTLFFSSLIGTGSSEVGASIDNAREDLKQVRITTISRNAPVTVETWEQLAARQVAGSL